MMKIPYRGVFEDLFASDKSIVLKMLGGAAVGGLSFLRVLKSPDRGGPDLSLPVKATILVGAALVGMLVVLLLSLRDVVARRVERGERVNLLLRSFFGRGNGCLMVMLWSFTVLFATMVVAFLTRDF